MPRTCTVCTHPSPEEIDRRLLEGAPLRNIAKQFSLSSASLFRHNKSIQMTVRYSHPTPKHTLAAVEMLAGLLQSF